MTFKSDEQKLTKTNVLELIKRYEDVSQKILNSPKFDDEAREVATVQATIYMLALTEIVHASSSVFPDESKSVVMASLEFCDLVDEFCASEAQA